MSDPQRPHGLQPTRLLRPWDFPGKSTGVGCHCLLRNKCIVNYKFTLIVRNNSNKQQPKEPLFPRPGLDSLVLLSCFGILEYHVTLAAFIRADTFIPKCPQFLHPNGKTLIFNAYVMFALNYVDLIKWICIISLFSLHNKTLWVIGNVWGGILQHEYVLFSPSVKIFCKRSDKYIRLNCMR